MWTNKTKISYKQCRNLIIKYVYFARRSIDGLLGGSDGVDSGHQALDDAELIVDDFGQRSQAVGSARSIGDNLYKFKQ